MKKEICPECGKEARIVRGNYRFDEVGILVLLKSVQLSKCRECGATKPLIRDLNELMHRIAFAVVTRPCKLDSKDLRFLRKYARLSGEEFSRLIQVQPETLSRWESGQRAIGKNSDRLIRFVIMSKSEDLRKEMEEFLEKYRDLTGCESSRNSRLNVDPCAWEYEYAWRSHLHAQGSSLAMPVAM